MTTAATNLSVREFMSTDIVTIPAKATVHEALEQFTANRVSALPVVDRDQKCVAIISATDLIEIVYEVDDDFVHANTLSERGRNQFVGRLSQLVGDEPVMSYASESVDTVKADCSIAKAASIMHNNQIHHLPVVDDKDRVIAMLSSMDVIAAVATETDE